MKGRFGGRSHRLRVADVLFGVGLGAAFMYVLGPGGRGRTYLRDHAAGERAARFTRDLAGRAGAALHNLGARFHRGVADDVLEERVRNTLAHVCDYASLIGVSARAGRVELRGIVLESEHARVVAAVKKTPGVRSVIDDLEETALAERVPKVRRGGRLPS